MKKQFIKFNWILSSFLIFCACANDSQPASSGNEGEIASQINQSADPDPAEKTQEPVANTIAPKPFEAKDLLYTWVDKLNIRESPDLKAKVVTVVNSDEAVEVIGEKSQQHSTYVLRGVTYVDHWYKVKTKAGDEGWIFGGAVKRENEKKGNPPITNEKFEFPNFGSFDLSSWKKLGTKKEGEEVDYEITTYKKGDRILEITKSDRGEFYYGHTYKLMDANKKVLKLRDFNFSADADINELTETVQDFTTSPATSYTRKQNLKKHFYDLNAQPVMVYGSWKESKANPTATNSTSSSAYDPTTDPIFAGQKKMFQLISLAEVPNSVDVDGCSCSFRTHPDNYKTDIFYSSFEDAPKEKAVIKLDGKTIVLNSAKFPNPDYKRGDYHAYYYNDKYELKIVAFENGKDDGGGKQYAGTMKLTFKDGTVLADINTFGGCGC